MCQRFMEIRDHFSARAEYKIQETYKNRFFDFNITKK